MNRSEWYEKGLTPDAYRQTLTDHKEGFETIFNTFAMPNDAAFFEEANKKKFRVLVLAEPWCGHCMLNIPILLRISEAADFPVRFLLRDENLELMDQHLTNGKSRSIPIFLFLNENGDEIGKWGPVAKSTADFTVPLKENLPEKGTPEYDAKFKEMIQTVSSSFRQRQDLWQGVYESLKESISRLNA